MSFTLNYADSWPDYWGPIHCMCPVAEILGGGARALRAPWSRRLWFLNVLVAVNKDVVWATKLCFYLNRSTDYWLKLVWRPKAIVSVVVVYWRSPDVVENEQCFKQKTAKEVPAKVLRFARIFATQCIAYKHRCCKFCLCSHIFTDLFW